MMDAAQGHNKVQYAAATKYKDGVKAHLKNLGKAFVLQKDSAIQKNPQAQHRLSLMYLQCIFIAKVLSNILWSAKSFSKKSAAQKNYPAQIDLMA